MLSIIDINLKTDVKPDKPVAIDAMLMSQDKHNNQFMLRFTNGGETVTLDDTYTVEILSKFTKSGTSLLTSATVHEDYYATWEFDTDYITQEDEVRNYVYVRKSDDLVVSADANCFYFEVGLSEIDKGAGKVAETYDENYEKYLDEFKDNVNFEEIAQAEQARKEAEILREESYEQKVDTAIVEADLVEKVDNKVTELTPQISNLTAQLAQTESSKVDKSGSGQVKWANIAQDAREQISGDKVAVVDDNSIITTNLTNNSVTPDKTSFLSIIDNLYMGTHLTGVTISESGGVKTIYGESMMADWQLAYIPIKNGVTYTVRARRKTATTKLFVAFSNELTNGAPIERVYDMESLQEETVVTVKNNNYKYMLIRADKGDGILQNLEIYESDSIPSETPIIKVNGVEVAKKSDVSDMVKKSDMPDISDMVKKSDMPDISVIDNLYTGNILSNLTISASTVVNRIYPISDYSLGYIPVKDGQTYTVRASRKTGVTDLFLAFTNNLVANEPIERVYGSETKVLENIATVTNTNNYDYLLIRADGSNQIMQNIEVYEGDSIPTGNMPIIKINDVEVAKKADIDNMRVKKYEGYLVTDHIDRYGVDTAADVYALYDSLLADHQQHRTYRITKNLLGEDDFGNNIYEYVFSRDTLDNHYDIRRKRIGLTSTTHGNETNTTIGLFEFMKALVINKDKNEVFNQIIGSVDIHIIPVLNPSGLALSTYHNANDVDIFANYDVNWEKLPHLNKGSSPASEPETQIAQNWMQQNMFDVYFDYHRSDPIITNNHFTWFSTDSEGSLKEEYVKTIGLLSLIKAQQYEEFPPYETFGVVKDYTHQGKSYSYANSIGSEGALLEVSGTWRYFPTDGKRLNLLVDWSKEVVGNMIMTVSRRWI
ncbi:M14 family zinc carboxypeptidase [Jeotgalibaca porci]|uniref:M14 family zinc carboxypeptidase n=1 Tax=Jeotgalibaca porci TaxID=1868793 RepID=UPI00359F7DD7